MRKKLWIMVSVVLICALIFAACAERPSDKITVVFEGNGGVTEENRTRVELSIEKGAEFQVPTFHKDGYIFVGWDTDLNKLTDGCVVKAQWIQGAAVTFDTQGGEMEEQDVFFGIGENVGKLPVPEKGEISPWNNMREYRFKGWYLNGSEIREGYTWNSDKTQVTLVAKWEKAVKVVFDSDGGTDFGYTYIYKNEEMGLLPTPEKGEVSAWNGVREYKFLVAIGPAFRRFVSPALSWYMGLGLKAEIDRLTYLTDSNIRDIYLSYLVSTDIDFGFRITADIHTSLRIGVYLTRPLFTLNQSYSVRSGEESESEYSFIQNIYPDMNKEDKSTSIVGYISLGHTYTDYLERIPYRYIITSREVGKGILEPMEEETE